MVLMSYFESFMKLVSLTLDLKSLKNENEEELHSICFNICGAF